MGRQRTAGRKVRLQVREQSAGSQSSDVIDYSRALHHHFDCRMGTGFVRWSTLLKSPLELAQRLANAALVCATCLSAACATPGIERRNLGQDRFHFLCRTALTTCLSHVGEVCQDRSYDVIAARDRRSFTGVEPAEREQRSSEAVVECRTRGTPLFDEGDLLKEVTTEAAPTASPAPEPPKMLCTPGTTQSCVGVGSCPGGQSCRDDGSGYDPCQCAEPPAPAPLAPTTNSETKEGAPPTIPHVPRSPDASH